MTEDKPRYASRPKAKAVTRQGTILVGTHVSPELHDKLLTVAKRDCRSLSGQLRFILEKWWSAQ